MIEWQESADPPPTAEGNADLKQHYVRAVALLERLHRRLLDVTKDEVDRGGRCDVTSVQAMVLFNVGESDIALRELRDRGDRSSIHVAHSLKKLIRNGYIRHQQSATDRRAVRLSLTEKGKRIATAVNDLYERHVQSIDQVGGVGAAEFQSLNRSLQRLERFWRDQVDYRL